jgi:GNAT superfamily N-acetyltransferase
MPPTPTAHTRRFTSGDVGAVTALILHVSHVCGWPLPADAAGTASARAWLDARAWRTRHVALDADGTVVGHAGTYAVPAHDPAAGAWSTAVGAPVSQLVAIGGAVVAPDRQRQGVGLALLAACLGDPSTAGAVPVFATLHADLVLPVSFGAKQAGHTVAVDGRPVALWWLPRRL